MIFKMYSGNFVNAHRAFYIPKIEEVKKHLRIAPDAIISIITTHIKVRLVVICILMEV